MTKQMTKIHKATISIGIHIDNAATGELFLVNQREHQQSVAARMGIKPLGGRWGQYMHFEIEDSKQQREMAIAILAQFQDRHDGITFHVKNWDCQCKEIV